MQGKWESVGGENYRIEDLGRPAVFLLPTRKLQQKLGDTTVENHLHQFLVEHFSSYTSSLVPSFGFWKNAQQSIVFDECREYEVSVVGKERIPVLLKKLGEIATIIQEDCLYVKAGQYSGLLYPT